MEVELLNIKIFLRKEGYEDNDNIKEIVIGGVGGEYKSSFRLIKKYWLFVMSLSRLWKF